MPHAIALTPRRQRQLVWAAAGACALSAPHPPVMAQTASESVQQVWITGTRLPAPGAEAPVPLLVVSSNDIAASGAANVQDLLQKLPALGLPGFSRSNSNFLPNGAGVATLNLRNLGEARTLVLVNGRRFVSGVPGNSAVDLNTLPTALIDRIEIMTGGASAAYGSDAVAGVVNLILKTGGAGWQYDVSAGRTGAGDDDTRRVALGWGATGPNGALNVLAAYTRQGAVYSRDRDYAANDQISKMVASGQAADAFIPVRNYSVAAPQGRFFFSRGPDGRPGEYTYDRAGNIIPWSTNGSATLAATGFNRADYRTIALPIERLLLAANGEQSLATGHRAWFEANLSRARIRTITEPLALSSADVYRASNGQVPADTLVNGVAQRNPLVPQYLYDRISDTNGDGLRDYSFSRRLAEAGTRSAAIDRNMHRLAVGLAGEPGGWLAGWRYDSYAVIGRATESQLTSGQVSVANFRNALAAIPAVGGGAMCADATARAQGCVPLNLFGYGTLSPEALAYILAPMGLETRVTQKLLGATISGAPWTLPAGPLGLAAGFEWRSESSDSIPDALTQAGGNSGGTIPRTRGAFTVREAYLEARVPLLKGAPLVHDAAFLGAWRAGNYSTVGRTTSWNGGLEWRPVPDVRLRATRALSTRAPNINELYAPSTQVSPTGISDPCLGVTATSAGTYDSACRAAPGVAANIAANGKFTLSQADLQGMSGFNRGNPDLKAEQGRSTTAGIVVTPVSVPLLAGWTFNADYFSIHIAGAIVPTPRQYALTQCYGGGDAAFCRYVTRRPAQASSFSAGAISFLDSAVSNSGGTATRGIDIGAAWSGTAGPGRLSARLAWIRLQALYNEPLPGAPRDIVAGEVGAPRHKGVLQATYRIGAFSIAARTAYTGPASLDDQFLAQYKLAPGAVSVASNTITDLQFTYAWRPTLSLYAGIDNAFNKPPAPVISGLPGDTIGTETHAGAYDAIGRRFYVGVRGAWP